MEEIYQFFIQILHIKDNFDFVIRRDDSRIVSKSKSGIENNRPGDSPMSEQHTSFLIIQTFLLIVSNLHLHQCRISRHAGHVLDRFDAT